MLLGSIVHVYVHEKSNDYDSDLRKEWSLKHLLLLEDIISYFQENV